MENDKKEDTVDLEITFALLSKDSEPNHWDKQHVMNIKRKLRKEIIPVLNVAKGNETLCNHLVHIMLNLQAAYDVQQIFYPKYSSSSALKGLKNVQKEIASCQKLFKNKIDSKLESDSTYQKEKNALSTKMQAINDYQDSQSLQMQAMIASNPLLDYKMGGALQDVFHNGTDSIDSMFNVLSKYVPPDPSDNYNVKASKISSSHKKEAETSSSTPNGSIN